MKKALDNQSSKESEARFLFHGAIIQRLTHYGSSAVLKVQNKNFNIHMIFRLSVKYSSVSVNTIGKVYTLEYTKILSIFFPSRHGR